MVVLLTITKTFHIRHAAGNPTPFPPLRSVRAVVFIAREQSSAFFYPSEANCTQELIVVLLLSFFGLPSSIARRRPLAPSLGWPCLGPPSSSIARRRSPAAAFAIIVTLLRCFTKILLLCFHHIYTVQSIKSSSCCCTRACRLMHQVPGMT